MGEHVPNARQQALRVLFTRMITAYGEKRFDEFATYLEPETRFEWAYRPLADFPGEMTGVANFLAMSKEGMADTDGYHHRVDRFYDMADPDMLIVEYHSDTRLKSSGKPYGNQYLGILRYRGDKVVFWKEYLNPLAILDAFGLDFRNEEAGRQTTEDD